MKFFYLLGRELPVAVGVVALEGVEGEGAVEPVAELLRAQPSVPVVVKGPHVAQGLVRLPLARALSQVKLPDLGRGDPPVPVLVVTPLGPIRYAVRIEGRGVIPQKLEMNLKLFMTALRVSNSDSCDNLNLNFKSSYIG